MLYLVCMRVLCFWLHSLVEQKLFDGRQNNSLPEKFSPNPWNLWRRYLLAKWTLQIRLHEGSWGGQWSWIIWVGPVHSGGFPGDSVGKESACSEGDAGDLGSIPGSGRSPCRRPWQPTSVFVPGESHGQRSLEGCSLWGCKESATEVTEHTHVHTALMRVLRSGRGRQRRRRGWDHVEAVHRCWLWRWRKWPQSGSKRELWMLEKQEKWILPRASRKEHSPADTLIWAQQDPRQTVRTIR